MNPSQRLSLSGTKRYIYSCTLQKYCIILRQIFYFLFLYIYPTALVTFFFFQIKILHKAYTIKCFIKAAVHIVVLATFLSVWKLATPCLLPTSPHERTMGNHKTAANGRILLSPRIPEQTGPPLDWIKRAGIPQHFSFLILHE